MSVKSLKNWIAEHGVEEVECMTPDMGGIARGKIIPAPKFLSGSTNRGIRLPEEIYTISVTGQYVQDPSVTDPGSRDIYMRPDANSIRMVPWYDEPTAQVIGDTFYLDDTPVDFAPRYVLKRILELYEEAGWRPVVAPELEFYLVAKNVDPDYPLEPPEGQMSGRTISGSQGYSIDAANEFERIIEDIYDYCEPHGIDIGTLSHESGPAQLEINFNHGEPLDLADQVMLFKRAVRQAAHNHGVYATFMAKPHEDQPGSSMHIHQSVVSNKTGKNLFATKSGKESRLFLNHIGGLQRYMAAAMAFFAPNVNSYRRLVPDSDAPTNVHWGIDNRTVSLRVPAAEPSAMRIENRVPGADCNPYLALAASLACGYLGMTEKQKPNPPVEGWAYRYAHTLPLTLEEALNKLTYTKPFKQVLGQRFIDVYQEVKETELQQYRKVISSWEREYLLLNV
ncbi:MAG: glutamine synthetase family protein [Hyphomicrobiales bacterium]